MKGKKAIVVFMIVATAGLLISSFVPIRMGEAELMRLAVKYICIILLGIGIVGISLVNQKDLKTVLILCLGIMCVLLGSFTGWSLIKGVQAGPQKIESGNYSVYMESSRGIKTYYMEVHSDSQKVKIKIGKSTYNYLRRSEADIKISYYPYINVAEKLEVK